MTIFRKIWLNLRYPKVLIVRHLDTKNSVLHICGRGWVIEQKAGRDCFDGRAYKGLVAIEGKHSMVYLDSSNYDQVLDWSHVLYYDRTPEGLFILLSPDGQPQNACRYRVEWISESQWKHEELSAVLPVTSKHTEHSVSHAAMHETL